MEIENSEIINRVLKAIKEAKSISSTKNTCILTYSDSLKLTKSEFFHAVRKLSLSPKSGLEAKPLIADIPIFSEIGDSWIITIKNEELFNEYSTYTLTQPWPENWKWKDEAAANYQFGDKQISYRGSIRKKVFISLMNLCIKNPKRIVTQSLKNELGYKNTERLHIEIAEINNKLKAKGIGFYFKGSPRKEGYYQFVPILKDK